MIVTRDITRELAEFAVAPLDYVSAPAWLMGKQMILTGMGLAIGASYDPAMEMEFATASALKTPPEATALGRGVKIGASWAALFNGTGVHLEDFDDTYYRCKLHPTGAIPPAALAAAEAAGASGRELIEAVVVGTEVAIRVGNALGEGHYDLRWQATGTFGHLGAAVAAARIFGLDERQMRHAIAIAATEAGGVLGSRGSMAKPFHVGKAAFDGVEAAFMAQLGVRGAPRAIEGTYGMAATMSGNFDESSFDQLGTHWEIENNVFKPYACGVVSHPILDAAIEMRKHFKPEEVERVEIRSHPMVLDIMGYKDPQDGFETKFSSYHCTAVGFLEGNGGPQQFSDHAAQLPQNVAFRKLVHIETTPKIAYGAATVTFYAKDGRNHTIDADSDRTMQQDEIDRKVKVLCGEAAEPMIRIFDRLESLPNLDELMAAVPPGPKHH